MKKKNNNNEKVKFESKEIKQHTIKNEDYQKVISFIVILVVVLVCLGGLFFFNGKYVSKDEFQNTTTTEAVVSIDNTVILSNDIFNQKDSKYMVMIFRSKDKTENMFNGSLVSGYQGNDKVYSVDLSNKMNENIYNVKEKEKLLVSNVKDLNVIRPTLLIIEKGKVTKAVTDNEEMISILK